MYVRRTYIRMYVMYVYNQQSSQQTSIIYFCPSPRPLVPLSKIPYTHTCVLCIGDLYRSCSTVPKNNPNLRIKTTESGYNGLPYIGLPFMCTKTRHVASASSMTGSVLFCCKSTVGRDFQDSVEWTCLGRDIITPPFP